MTDMRHHAIFWSVATAALILIVWMLGNVLFPFVVGMAIAYLLGPVVKRMINAGVPRQLAALMILLSFFVVMAAIIGLIAPFAYREIVELATNLPAYADKVQDYLSPYITLLQEKFHMGDLSAYQETLKNNIGRVLRFGGAVLLGLLGGGQAVVGFITFIVVAPIVAFFMMEEWVRITKWIDDMIPRGSYTVVRDLLTQIDRKLSGFIRGQLMIAAFLGIVYAIALTIAGLKFGFLIGLLAGAFSIIPLVGSTVGLIVAVLVAWLQSQSFGYTGFIAAIFLIGQFLEGNFITPRIMGQTVGLHPLWIIFALLAGGALFGIVGMFLAVPVAAVIGVLSSFVIGRYKVSEYYNAPVLDQQSNKVIIP